MKPEKFPEANKRYGPPEGLAESQVMTIWAYEGQIKGGSLDGCQQVVTAWRPTEGELAALNLGGVIYLSFVGGLPPHYPSVSFVEATNPA